MFKFIPGAYGTTTSLISSGTTLMPVSTGLADILDAFLDTGDWTYLLLRNGLESEVVKVTAINGLIATIVRGIDGTTPAAFPSGTTVCSTMAQAAVIDIIAANGVPAVVNVIGSRAVTVETEDGITTVDVPFIDIAAVAGGGIEILGEYPNFSLTLTNPSGCCDDDDSAVAPGSMNLVGAGIASVELLDPTTYRVTVETPNFSGTGGISVTGTWPDMVFGFAGSVGTVTSVGAGTGLTLTGSPSVSPTLSISATGVVAGTYGGIIINAQGQIVAVPTTLNPVSIITVTPNTGINYSRTGDEVTLAGIDAAEGIKGVMALADIDGPLDPGNETEAVTPALLANVLGDLAFTEAEGGQTYVGEADASYTNIVPATAVSLDIPAGGKAFVMVSVTVKDNADITIIPEWALALFDTSPIRLQACGKLKQQQQVLHCLINGPYVGTLAVATTDLTGFSVNSYSIQAIII